MKTPIDKLFSRPSPAWNKKFTDKPSSKALSSGLRSYSTSLEQPLESASTEPTSRSVHVITMINLSTKISEKFLRNLQRAKAKMDRKLRQYAVKSYEKKMVLLRAAERDAVGRQKRILDPHAVIYDPDAQAEADRQRCHLLRAYETK